MGWKSSISTAHAHPARRLLRKHRQLPTVFGFTTAGGGAGVNGTETRNAETRSNIWGIGRAARAAGTIFRSISSGLFERPDRSILERHQSVQLWCHRVRFCPWEIWSRNEAGVRHELRYPVVTLTRRGTLRPSLRQHRRAIRDSLGGIYRTPRAGVSYASTIRRICSAAP